MTQAISRISRDTSLKVQFSSMSPIETNKTAPTALRGAAVEEIEPHSLLLYPGEVGEILVRLENPGERPLRFQVTAEGDFPAALGISCQIDPDRIAIESVSEIAESATTEISLLFNIPADFFEQQDIIYATRPKIAIDHSLQICIYQLEASGSRLVGYQSLPLAVRPRTTYLDFLPELYREVDFIGRFLAIFEQTFDPYVQTLDTLWAYLDPLTAPEPLLPFLAHWVAWKLDPALDLDYQRRLIRNAIELYRWHGTRQGLRLYLHLYTQIPCDETHIAIEEVFSGGLTFGNCQFGQNALLGGGRPYHFVVRLRPDENHPAIDESLVRRVIEREKPPFCTYDLSIDRVESSQS